MGAENASYSQWGAIMAGLRRNRLAWMCLWLLGLMYFSAIFADFLSPYSFSRENRDYSYCPPMMIRIVDEEGRWQLPFVYGQQVTLDENHRRVYRPLTDQKYPVRLFVRGDPYKVWGIIPATVRLFGVEEPGRLFLLGTDARGRDFLSRLLYGGRISLFIGIIGVAISFSIGLVLGGVAGYYGGRVDEIIMRLCEMIMMIPGFYLLLALRAAVPDNFNSVQVFFAIIIILSFISWAGLTRIIRGMCLSLKSREYVLAAKTFGVSDLKIILRHILPHTLSYSIIAVMLSIPGYILGESGLSILGLGIVDPYASWGNMLSDAMSVVHITFAPWILLPGFMILLAVMCFNVIGDALRDCLDPHLKMKKGI